MRRLSLAAGLVLIGAVAPGAAANTATIGSALSQPSKVNGIQIKLIVGRKD